MYAIVDIAGQQFRVEKERKIFVHRLAANEGETVEFAKVLLLDNDGKVTIGAPVIDGAKVTAKVLAHVKGEKVIVFNKIQKNGYFFSDSCDTVKKDQFFQSRVQTVTFLRLQFTHHMYSGNDHACMRN